MIICRAGFRISLFGGGSDHPNFIAKHGYGLVISAAIDKYGYVQVKELPPFFPYKSRLTYSEVENVNSISEVKHRVFKNCLMFTGLQKSPIEINYTADLPGSIGLGTSSTMIVCMLEALRQYKWGNTYPSKESLWGAASFVEREMMGETVGLQDYLPAIYGYIRGYRITNTSVSLKYVNANLYEIINNYGLLFYLGGRNSSMVLSNYIDNIAEADAQLEILRIAENALEEKNIVSLGRMLTETWLLKRSLSPAVSTPQVDEVINTCIREKCLGAKLCGSGGGGCVFVLASPDRHYNIVNAVQALGSVQIPFKVAPRGVERIL